MFFHSINPGRYLNQAAHGFLHPSPRIVVEKYSSDSPVESLGCHRLQCVDGVLDGFQLMDGDSLSAIDTVADQCGDSCHACDHHSKFSSEDSVLPSALYEFGTSENALDFQSTILMMFSRSDRSRCQMRFLLK